MPRQDNPSRDTIINQLEEIYRGPAWHGPSVLEALDGVTAETAAKKPSPKRNSIWELVLHVTHGRHLLIERLQNKTFDFPRKTREPWWPVMPAETSDAAWRKDLQLLDEYQTKTVAALKGATDAELMRVPSDGDQTLAQQMLGLAFHDAYHAGQMKLLALG